MTAIAYSFCLLAFMQHIMCTQNGKLTFINEDTSSVKLREQIWKPAKLLQFKVIANGDDGTLLTARTGQNDKLQLSYESGSLKLKLNDVNHHVPGLTDRVFNLKAWHDFSIAQSSVGLRIGVNDIRVMVPLLKREGLMMNNWEEVYLGKSVDRRVPSRSFVGCIDLGKLHHVTEKTNNVESSTGLYIAERTSVLNSCVDACSVQSCKNGGRCINNYNHAICDCRGTGYQGGTCEQASPAAHFDGESFIAYDTAQNPILDWRHDIEIRFRTTEERGILLTTSFEEDFLIIEMYHKKIYTTAKFGKGVIHMKNGHNLNDGKWHFVTLGRRHGYLNLQVDNKTSAKAVLSDIVSSKEDTLSTIRMTGGEELVYFGGAKDVEVLKFSYSKRNLIGCLQQAMFNGHDVLQKILYDTDWKFTHSGKLRECHDENS